MVPFTVIWSWLECKTWLKCMGWETLMFNGDLGCFVFIALSMTENHWALSISAVRFFSNLLKTTPLISPVWYMVCILQYILCKCCALLLCYFHPSPQCMYAAIAPHQSCHAAASGTVCTLGLSLSSPSSLPRSLLGPATLVMRAEYTIRACHTLTAGAAPLPRLGYRLKHLLINTDLPLLPLSTHTCMHAHAHTYSRWLLLAAFSQ